eukprot:7526919-Ditylum_brightwellii.AAC.1
MIQSCFAETATIRDVCGINDSIRSVNTQDLADRCMDFLTAHPDCKVDFHYPPMAGRTTDENGKAWVLAHWYETGTWSGESCGIVPPQPPRPMAVEGQTRFSVDPGTLKINELVVTRTFTEWENEFQKQQQQKSGEGNNVDEMLRVAQQAARAAGDVIKSHKGCCSETA